MMRTAIVIVAALLLAAVLARPAEACSQQAPLVVDDEAGVTIAGIPTSGLVPIYVRARIGELAPGHPTVTVRDDLGAEVSGAFELTRYRLVWRADAPLQPDSTYAMTISAGPWGETALSFTTAADDAIPSLALTPGDTHLEELSETTTSICCNAGIDSCENDFYQQCWAQSADYHPSLSVAFELDGEAARFYRFEHEAPGASTSSNYVGARFGNLVWAEYVDRKEDYCVTLRALPLIGDAVVTRTVCQSDSALVQLPPFVPEQPDYALCTDAPVDPDTHEEVDTGSGGCSAGTSSTASGWWMVLLIVAVGSRRRGRAPHEQR
jgi:hypothetical protein